MRAFRVLLFPAVIGAVLMLFGSTNEGDAVPDEQPAAMDLLVFSKTEGYRHKSIADGIAALRTLARTHGAQVTATEDATRFVPDTLRTYDAVVFLNTTGNVLNEAQQTALRRYVEGGGGFVGVHAASDTEYEWNWYHRLVGAYFNGHPPVQSGTLTVTDPTHPSTEPLPSPWHWTDEWYSLRDVRDDLQVILTLDETSYDLGDAPSMGTSHPVAWHQRVGKGRSWYTALGHPPAAYRDSTFRAHLWGGVQWASGDAP